MTKSDLIDHVGRTWSVPTARAEPIVNAIFDALEEALKRGERIEIRGLGSFEVRSYKSYEGRNPRTGSTVAVKAKKLPFFKVGKELKERIARTARAAAAANSGKNGGTIGATASTGAAAADGASRTAQPPGSETSIGAGAP